MKTNYIKILCSTIGFLAAGICVGPQAFGQQSARGVNSLIYALATDTGGNVYAGGQFTAAGNVSANYVAAWHPSTRTWSTLNDGSDPNNNGINGLNAEVDAIAIGGDGQVYVGGAIGGAGTKNANNIAAWNPANATWSAMNGGVYDNPSPSQAQVKGIAVNGTMVYVVGRFSNAGGHRGFGDGIGTTNIAAWNSSSGNWSAITNLPSSLGIPNTVAVHGNVIYVGGQLGIVQSPLGGTITWQRMDSNLVGSVSAIAFAPDGRMFVGGDFHLVAPGSQPQVGIAVWNGTKFVSVPNIYPQTSDVGVLAITSLGNNLIVGGYFYLGVPGAPNPASTAANVAGFNLSANSWFALGATTSPGTTGISGSPVYALAVSGGTVYAGGSFATAVAGDLSHPDCQCIWNIAKWDSVANAWSVMLNIPPTVSVTTDSSTYCAPANITVSANAQDVDCGVAKVDFYANGSLIRTVTAPPFSFIWNSVPAGTYSLTAIATDTDGVQTPSLPITVSVRTSAFITTQPQSQTVCAGTPVTFTVVAGGSAPLTYQWQFNNVNIPGATNATYPIPSAAPVNAGNYTVVVGNGCGSVVSDPAHLTVLTAPSITSQPQSQTVCAGSPVTFAVAASGSAPLTYQWRFNNTNLGATGPAYSIPSAVPGNAGNYTVVVSNACGSVVSAPAVLTVNTCCTPAPSGLVSWWRAENDANDSVGNHNGTLFNGVGFAGGEVGQAFSFNGNNQAVVIPYSPSLVSTQYSMEAWVKPTSQVTTEDGQEVIFGESYGFGQLVVRPGTTGVQVVFLFGNGGGGWYEVDGTADIPIGQFTHVIGTWDGTTLKLYINGVLNNTSTPGAAPVSSGCPFYIGGFYSPDDDECWTVSQFFVGLIDEVSYYNRPLTPAEVQALYNAGSAGKCPPSCTPAPSGLVSWWRAETNANDSVGNHNGTLVNGAGFASGEVGQAFSFNGDDQAVVIPYSPSLVSTQYSMEAWVKPTSQVTTEDGQEVIYGESYGFGQLVVRPGTTGVQVIFLFGNGGGGWYEVDGTTNIPIGQFTHVIGTWDGTTLKLYINGVLNNTSIPGAVPVPSGCPFYIGGFYSPDDDDCWTVGQFFVGLIDEVSYYNRPLAPVEVQALYNARSAGKCPP